jgi:hypothetical protein
MATTDELVRIDGQAHEILKRVGNGSLDARSVRKAMQAIIEGKLPEDSQFDRFGGYLLSLDKQLERIARFDNDFWGGRIRQHTNLKDIDTTSDHIQRVDDLEVLYVDFGSPEDNVELWWKVLVGKQPNAWRYDGLKAEHLRLAATAHQYEPGVHRIRLNLVAHWEPEVGRTVQEVRQQAQANGETLAAAEVLAAYGLHDHLLQQMDGENLPYADLGGYEATIPGDEAWRRAPYLYWDRSYRKVLLYAYWDDYRYYGRACPVRRES